MKISVSYIICIFSLLMGCSNETILEEYEISTPIYFSSSCISIHTKSVGGSCNGVLPENSRFSLFSIQHPLNIAPAKWNPALFNNTLGTSDAYGDILYDNTYYFPVGDQLDFFAIHPFISSATTGSDYSGSQTVAITLKENTADQYDLMYASLLNQSKKSPTLVFEFHHLLTQITVNILKAPDVTIDLPLTQIQLVAPQSATLDIWNGQLSNLQGQATYMLQTDTLLSNNETLIPGQFLLFPQKATRMILTFGTDGKNVFEVTLSDDPQTWEPGFNYQYNITISRNIPESVSTDTPVDNTENTPVDNTPVNNETTTDPNNVASVTKAIAPNTVMVYRSID